MKKVVLIIIVLISMGLTFPFIVILDYHLQHCRSDIYRWTKTNRSGQVLYKTCKFL